VDFKKAKSNKEQKAKFPQLNKAHSHSLVALPKTPKPTPLKIKTPRQAEL